ncbi:hypothetical protein GJAV_G00007620 [Gymnothorax javanicus]|nr:hypothetical protein GJAV_G00007620 [Gymnothorax javanicus]
MCESGLLQGMNFIIMTFMKYSVKQGDKHTLNRNELRQLFNEELGPLFETCSNQDELDKLFTGLDENQDGVVDFQEFCTLVCTFFMLCDPKLCSK